MSSKGDNQLKAAFTAACERFISNNPKSKARWEQASTAMPGGNTRTVLHYDPFPLTMAKGEGSYLEDIDGHRYCDFLGEYSAGLYGHSNPKIQAAIIEAIGQGTVLGAPNRWEGELAQEICKRFAAIDLVRFTNSGTEANLMALGAARAFTGRSKILVFKGGYHGGLLYFGHGASPVNAPYDVLLADYNDLEGCCELISAHASELAAVLVEPMMGSGGCIPGEQAFLEGLRKATQDHGILLIFDEVMTSRSTAGGLQARLGIAPDLTTLGKYLGGGCSFGAFGGRSDVMSLFDPRATNALPHAGTFNNNVMTMAAGLTGLREILTPEAAEGLYQQGEDLKGRLNGIIADRGLNMQASGCGSIIGLHCHKRPLRSAKDAHDDQPEKRKLLHLEMLELGYSFAQRGYMSLNLAMTEEDYDSLCQAFEAVVERHSEIFSA